jgi:hypothetical protein
VPLAAVIGPIYKRKVCTARWKAWKDVLGQNPNYSIAGLGRVSGWNHASIIWGIRRLEGAPARARNPKRYKMNRREFSNYVMAENAKLGMTAEAFSEATGVPLETVLSRAKEAGIVMERKWAIGGNVPELIEGRNRR